MRNVTGKNIREKISTESAELRGFRIRIEDSSDVWGAVSVLGASLVCLVPLAAELV